MKRTFRGWYFKQQAPEDAIAFIPALHVDEEGRPSASLQIVTEEGAHVVPYDYDSLKARPRTMNINLGPNRFNLKGLHLDVETEEVAVAGDLHFDAITPLRYDIMGPFRFVPFMECRHSVFSMAHNVSGKLTVNGKLLDFSQGKGYIEGDRGCSFPRRYLWTQCVFGEEGSHSLMLSVADIPLLRGTFTGIISAIRFGGKEYRLATYLGARLTHMEENAVTVRQGRFTLSARLLSLKGHALQAPVRGGMTRSIREHLTCRAHYRFSRGPETLFDFTSNQASFEYEYTPLNPQSPKQ